METRQGKLLGRYEIVAEIGRGAMGAVYKARDPKIDRIVAIKTILLHQSGVQEQSEFRERFFIEAQAAGRLLHPGIVAVFDVGEEPGTSDPYIVMEYIEGQTLRELLLQENGRLPLDTALRITQELAEALDYAHSQGVVHRDIKPANILITNEGQAKIGDFGIAQLDLSHMTLPGRVLGTPAYMSPEQLEGEKVDGRSDLFSLGAILYSELTGFSPFQGSSATTVCFKVANRDPLQATTLAPDLPPELDSVISRALAKNPAERYQRGREFARDLRQLRQRAPGAPKGALWFSQSEGHRTWLDAAAKTAGFDTASSTRKSSNATGNPSKLGTSNLLPRFSSSRVLAGPLLSFFAASTILGFFAWRQIRISTPAPTATLESVAKQNTAVIPKEKTDHAVNGTETPAEANKLNELDSDVAATTTPNIHKTARAVPKSTSAVPKTIAKAGVAAPAPSIKPAPKTTEPSPSTPASTSLVADSNVELHIDNHFSDGTLSIWIDDKLTYQHPLHDGHKKKLILLGGGIKETVTLPLPSGKHTLRAQVKSVTEQYDESKSVTDEFLKGGEKILAITFDKHTKEMRLTLGGN
jgi:serine/threonine protein kinase